MIPFCKPVKKILSNTKLKCEIAVVSNCLFAPFSTKLFRSCSEQSTLIHSEPGLLDDCQTLLSLSLLAIEHRILKKTQIFKKTIYIVCIENCLNLYTYMSLKIYGN